MDVLDLCTDLPLKRGFHRRRRRLTSLGRKRGGNPVAHGPTRNAVSMGSKRLDERGFGGTGGKSVRRRRWETRGGISEFELEQRA